MTRIERICTDDLFDLIKYDYLTSPASELAAVLSEVYTL